MISLELLTAETFPGVEGQILRIERESFPSPWDSRSFASEMDRDISQFWVAVADGLLIGYICFWIAAREVHLLNIAVRKDWRRRGLGRRLLLKMLEIGTDSDAEAAWLEVRPSNLAARALYRKMGFREVGRRPGYYSESHEDAILMTVDLPKWSNLRGSAGQRLEGGP